MMDEDRKLDGCKIDFKEHAIGDDEVESLLIPVGEEEDEIDDEDEPVNPQSPDLGLATRLRKGSIILGGGKPLFAVREVDGWKTRGRDFAGTQPAFHGQGSVNHHTAGAPPTAGNSPSLGICVNGTAKLPGPLCTALQAYDDTAIVIAAGVANHAGSGRWQGLDENREVYGLEVEHPGKTRVAQRRVTVMVGIHACFLWRPNAPDIPAKMACQHWEWDKGDPPTAGKIDFATNFSTPAQADEFRKMVAQALVKLNAVSSWGISYLNTKRERVPGTTRDPDGWVNGHMGAMRRGKVIFTPKRG